jgi:hypothetical protein
MEISTHTFDQAELELLKVGLKRTYKERFEMAARSTNVLFASRLRKACL